MYLTNKGKIIFTILGTVLYNLFKRRKYGDKFSRTLTFLQIMGIEPNFSELSRIFKKDRHTIKNMYAGKEAKIGQKKPSQLDQYKDEIIEILSNPGVRIKSIVST